MPATPQRFNTDGFGISRERLERLESLYNLPISGSQNKKKKMKSNKYNQELDGIHIYPESSKTFGFEYEAENITPAEGAKIINSLYNIRGRITHDASCESSVRFFDNMAVEGEFPRELRNSSSIRTGILGTELVFNIIPIEKALPVFKHLTSMLRVYGESGVTTRAAIHYHLSMPLDLVAIKNILRFGAFLEPVFFRIGGLGTEYRGNYNNSNYCRPITGKGPVVVPFYYKGDIKYTQTFNLNHLLEAKTLDEFWWKYGSSDIYGKERWMPVRYHWLNFIPLFNLGSLEFRIFNKVLDSDYMWTALKFCKFFCDKVLEATYTDTTYNLEVNSAIGFDQDKTEEIAYMFFEIVGGEKELLENIIDLINVTPPYKIDDVYYKCHLRRLNNFPHWRDRTDYANSLKPIPENKIRNPTFADIHNQGEIF